MTVPSSQPQIKVQPSPDLAKAYREKTTFARIAYILLAIECALTGIVVLFLIIAAVLMTIFSSLVSSLVHHSASKDASVFAWYRNYVLISSYTTVLFYAVSFA